ncbi:hypothetical protein [Mobiluncus curtisii]|uniref:hypothetical protein n=1 Tax=Mobiluncus curtisii TaxID=2051 RepID=UPI002431094E|nr:hypothetical protein [Mobiluncus curtisii]
MRNKELLTRATPLLLIAPASLSRVAVHPQIGTSVAHKNKKSHTLKIAKYQPKTLIGGTCGTCKQLLAHTRKANKHNIKTRIKKELANQVPSCHPDKAVTARA